MFNECRHVKDDGQRCRAAALKGKPYCFFHMKLDRMHKQAIPEIPALEDSTSVLLAIGQVMKALNYETINCKRAGLMLYGLQIAATVTARKEQATPAETVRSLHNVNGDPVEFTEAFGSGAPMLAPETSVCEPPHDCGTCEQKQSCPKRIATTQSSTPAWDPKKEHNPERAAREVREQLWAIAVERMKEDGPLPENLPTIEDVHRYFAIPEDDDNKPYSAPLPTPLDIHPLKAPSRPLAAM